MADAVIVSTARTPIGKAFRGVFNDTPRRRHGRARDQARRRARQGRPGRSRGRDPGLRRAGRHHGLQRRPRLGDARRRPGQRLGRDRQPLLLLGPADHLDGRPARAGRQGAGDDRRRPRVGLAGPGPSGRQQEPPGQPLGAGARPGHLSRHDHDRRHGRRPLQDQPRGAGRVLAAEPAAHRGRPAGRQVRRRDRGDGDHDAGHRQEHQRDHQEDGQARQGRGQPPRHDASKACRSCSRSPVPTSGSPPATPASSPTAPRPRSS